MADVTDNDLLDYEEEDQVRFSCPYRPAFGSNTITVISFEPWASFQTENGVTNGTSAGKKEVKGTYVSIHSSGFRDFLLKPEILRAIADCGFEHPSEGKGTLLRKSFSSHFLTKDYFF